MLDESHLSVHLWLKSVGIQNPFSDGSDGSERSHSRASSQNSSPTYNRGGRGGPGGTHSIATDTNDVLVPPEEAEVRKTTVYHGSTALALTLAGACALEAPYAFQKCGIFWGTVFFAAIAFASERVLYMLCLCARKTGSNSYGTVAKSSCGAHRARWQTSFLEIGILLLLLAHYVTLLRRVSELWLESIAASDFSVNLSLLAALLAMTPILVPQKFHNLGHTCGIGLFTMLIFASTLAALAIINYYEEDNMGPDQNAQRQADSLDFENGNSSPNSIIYESKRTCWDVIEGVQSFLLAFMASFNILPIQASLENPTRERMAAVVHRGVLMGALLTYFVGLGGYLCAQASGEADFLESIRYHTDDSNHTDRVLLYRICHSCCGLTIFLATPLVLIPCRHTILELVEAIYSNRQCPEVSDCQEDCETCTTRSSTQPGSNNAYVVVHEETSLLPSIEEHPAYDLESSKLAQGFCTLGILGFAYTCASFLTLVDDLFAWLGPILVYVFAFILPASYFLGIQRHRRSSPEKHLRLLARIIIFVSTAGIVLSIVDIVYNLPKGRSH